MLDPEKGWLASSFLPSFLSSSPSFFFFFFSSSSWYLLVPPDALPVPLSRRLAGPLHPEIKKLMGGRAVGACYVYVVPGFMSAPPRYRSARTPIGTACLVSKSLPPPPPPPPSPSCVLSCTRHSRNEPSLLTTPPRTLARTLVYLLFDQTRRRVWFFFLFFFPRFFLLFVHRSDNSNSSRTKMRRGKTIGPVRVTSARLGRARGRNGPIIAENDRNVSCFPRVYRFAKRSSRFLYLFIYFIRRNLRGYNVTNNRKEIIIYSSIIGSSILKLKLKYR